MADSTFGGDAGPHGWGGASSVTSSASEPLRDWHVWRTARDHEFEVNHRDYLLVIEANSRDADPEVIAALRADVETATRWTARRDAVLDLARIAYTGVLEIGWLTPAVAVVFTQTAAPVWLRTLYLLITALSIVDDVPFALEQWLDAGTVQRRQKISDYSMIACLILTVTSVVWWDDSGWSMLLDPSWRLASLLAVTGLAFVVVRLMDYCLGRRATTRFLWCAQPPCLSAL